MAASELDEVIDYWFDTLKPADWFRKSATLDADITQRFGSLHKRLSREKIDVAALSASEVLAVVIVLDQFSRNMYRKKAQAFACDAQALALAQQLVDEGRDQQLPPQQRVFVYMPYMHSESLTVHHQAVELFTKLGIAKHLKYERKHRDIIKRFGRYPHRNKVLGRTSTDAELEFLQQPGSSF